MMLSRNYDYLQELIQTVFDIGIPILGLILSETETTIKPDSSFLIKEQRKGKVKNRCNV